LNNAIITSLISRLPPEDLQIFFADLKGGVEFQVYADLPHIPSRDGHRLVTKAADLPAMLLAIQMEMERRTELMRGKARDLDGYNAHTAAHKQLPYIVVVIDEIASAMLAKERVKLAGGASETVRAATERLLADIAARARATGIHLIISTQRPSVDVITGLIKANFPCRVAFGTSSDVDSRVIVDDSRAQGLPPGRCMFRRNMSLQEYQAPLISESEIEAAVEAVQNGNFLPPPESKEDKARREIAFLIKLGIRDFKGDFPIVKLSRHPEVQTARISEPTVRKYHARLKAEGVIGGRFGRQTQRILNPEAYYHMQSSEIEILDAAGNPGNSIELRKCSVDDPDIEQKILQWASEGVGRAEMHKRISGSARRIQAVIIDTLGPAYNKNKATCHAVAPEEPQPEATEEEYATAPVDA
jgi:DNA segregation ATPase FtsK/SpoIIIE-like protein